MEVPSRQEMFDLAVRGLHAQRWRQSISPTSPFTQSCTYTGADGMRCAWGHVDLSLNDQSGDVFQLHINGVGLAGWLAKDDLQFALELQFAHDRIAPDGAGMRENFLALASKYDLVWPDDVPQS